MEFKNTEVWGFKHALRGMRNPKDSWDKSDSEYWIPNKFMEENVGGENIEDFNRWLDMLLRMGRKHITVLRYIDVSIMTEGIHRAGQD